MILNPEKDIKIRKTVYASARLWEIVEHAKIILKEKSQSKIIADGTILYLETLLGDHLCEHRENNPISIQALEYLRSELFKIQHPEEKKE